MGEKYIKIHAMVDNDSAEEKCKELRAFFDDCKRAYDWWQKHRDPGNGITVEAYWARFAQLFPRAHAFMTWRHDGPIVVHPNEIAGQLSWASTCTRRRFTRRFNIFEYVSEVWSGAELTPIAAYLLIRFKARHAWAREQEEAAV
jgi:hypothetical protein